MIVGVFLSCNALYDNQAIEQNIASAQPIDVAAYHDEPRWRPFFEGNQGEWEIIRNAVKKVFGTNGK